MVAQSLVFMLRRGLRSRLFRCGFRWMEQVLQSVRSPLRLRGHKSTAIVHAVEEHALVLLATAGGYPGAPAKRLALV